MSLLVDLAIWSAGFGFGWVASRLFSNGFFSDLDDSADSDIEDEELDVEYSRSEDEQNSTESPIRVGVVKPNRSRVHRRLRRLHRRRQLNRCHHRKFKNTRKELIEAIERNTKALNNVNFISSESIKSLETAISSLNETLKNVDLQRQTEDNCGLIEDGKVESSRGMKVLFADPKPANTYMPEHGGTTAGIKDESASMHIYDANFKPPKYDWTLNTDCSQELYDYWKNRREPSHTHNEKKESQEKSSSVTRDELRNMFQDCKKGNKKEPTLLTKPGGGYANMSDLNAAKKTMLEDMEKPRHSKPKPRLNKNVLSRGDELDVINSFSSMKGMGWEEAKNLAQEQGYSLHATYINEFPNYTTEYSKTVLGVRVKDADFDPELSSDAKCLSDKAIILAVVDVGGQDTYKRALSTM